MREFISIGQIINTHGLKGELKVYPLTDDIRRFRKLTEIYINEILYKIVWCKLQTDKVILKLEGIDTIEAAQRLKNNYLEVKRENAVSLEEGEFFIADIIGCKVYDENMKELGAIFDVIQTPSNDVYWVKGKEEILIPALKNVVLSISVDKREVIIKPLEVWQQ